MNEPDHPKHESSQDCGHDNDNDNDHNSDLPGTATATGAIGSAFDLVPPFAQAPAARLQRNERARICDPDDIIAQLARDYVLVIQNPAHLQTLTPPLVERYSPDQQLRPMTAQEQAQYAALFPQHYSLEDVVHGRLTIDQVLENLGPCDEDVFKLPEPEDVLMLFADPPTGKQRTEVPEIIRRDHHAIGLDSHLSIPVNKNTRGDDVQ